MPRRRGPVLDLTSSPTPRTNPSLRACIALAAAISLALCCLGCPQEAKSPDGDEDTDALGRAGTPLNVILVMIDTLRRDHVSAYGYERETSPNIDRFFRDGSRFTNATTPSPCTVPAVLQVLTGTRDFEDARPRLAERLHDAGYLTAAFVSQHQFGHRAEPKAAYRRGFDVFDIQTEEQVDRHGMSARRAGEVTERALAWLDTRAQGTPFFLWLHYFDPHDPYDPPEAYRRFPTPAAGMHGDRRARLQQAMDEAMAVADEETRARILARPNAPAHFGATFDEDEVRTLRSDYDSEILYTDAALQRVFDALSRAHLLDDSLVILTSDHGERLGVGNRWAHCQSLHGSEINVPLFVRHPRRTSEPRIPGAVSTLDIVPTVLGALEFDAAALRLDGSDLFDPRPNRLVHSVWSHERAVQNDRWKLVVSNRRDRGGARLYDLAADPSEAVVLHDLMLIDEKMALQAAMQAHARGDAALLGRIEDVLQELRAIGYVQ